MFGSTDAIVGSGVANLGQDRSRHVEKPQHVVVPGALADVVEHCARGIGGVGRVNGAIGETPKQEAVDGAEGEFAALGGRAGAGCGVERPGDFGRGEIRVEKQARHRRHLRLAAAGFQRRTRFRGTAVLPNDGVADRLAGRAIPDEDGLALIRNADRGQVRRLISRSAQRLAGRRNAAGPERFASCSTQPGRGKICGDLFLRVRNRRAVGVEDDRTG